MPDTYKHANKGWRHAQTDQAGAAAPPLPDSVRLAAPSFVWVGNLAHNCLRLQGLVHEVGVCLFETEACLAYTDEDLPAWLATLPLGYHIHLPLDLPWARGFDAAWEKIVRLAQKTAWLRPSAYVLHPPAPPAGGAAWLDRLGGRLGELLAIAGIGPGQVLLENVRECDLTGLWPGMRRLGLGACLDVGHLLAYHQAGMLDLPGLWDNIGMLHLSAPDPAGSGRHLSLRSLDRDGRAMLEEVLAKALGQHGGAGRPDPPTLMVELFQAEPFLDSLRFLGELLAGRTGQTGRKC